MSVMINLSYDKKGIFRYLVPLFPCFHLERAQRPMLASPARLSGDCSVICLTLSTWSELQASVVKESSGNTDEALESWL